MVSLPSPRPDVAGLLPGDPPLSVLAPFGMGGDHVLVFSSQGVRYGLCVVEVLGVRRFDDDQIGPPPEGQQGELISATLYGSDELTLVIDPQALVAQL